MWRQGARKSALGDLAGAAGLNGRDEVTAENGPLDVLPLLLSEAIWIAGSLIVAVLTLSLYRLGLWPFWPVVVTVVLAVAGAVAQITAWNRMTAPPRG